MANRLAQATSPYLQQHKDNPVDWWEWSETAFAEARRRDVPILLSVGYAACHWCHVMAHDSFEVDEVAERTNAWFVPVKVDREERPDVDAVYMNATMAMNGQGGWPMTCFLTPDGAPFFTGTFFPRAQFLQLLQGAHDAWTDRREDVLRSGQQVVAALAEQELPGGLEGAAPDVDVLDQAAATAVEQADRVRGGIGGAPKFPPSMVLEFLLRQHERTGSPESLAVVVETCEAMARGGMYDQLAGGFARYSVDADWVVPHFEKMLYDNALLLRVYTHLWRTTGSALAQRVVRDTAAFLLRDLATPQGGFASALDADTDGVEGLTYAWTPQQLLDVLGPDDATAAAGLFTVTDRGTFEHGSSTLQLRHEPADPQWFDDVRARLLAARDRRPQPARDDKVVTAWNGLAIAALAEAGALFGEPAWLQAARTAADLMLDLHLVDGRLRRTSRDGSVGEPAGVLEDYADLAEGLLALHQATRDIRYAEAAEGLLDTALAHFADGAGGFFDTADDAEALVRRPRDPTDNATPAGQNALAGALVTSSALHGRLDHRDAATKALGLAGRVASRQPRFFGWALAVSEALVSGPLEVAIVGESTDGPLTRTALVHRPPGAVVMTATPDEAGIPLFAGRAAVDGGPTAYVCRGMVCEAPVTSAEALAAALAV